MEEQVEPRVVKSACIKHLVTVTHHGLRLNTVFLHRSLQNSWVPWRFHDFGRIFRTTRHHKGFATAHGQCRKLETLRCTQTACNTDSTPFRGVTGPVKHQPITKGCQSHDWCSNLDRLLGSSGSAPWVSPSSKHPPTSMGGRHRTLQV